MPSPSPDMMWQEIRSLRARICELEQCCEEKVLPPPDVWIDSDYIDVVDNDYITILYAPTVVAQP